ncbi:HNH endonuclease [Nocardioides jejuensis]|nr:HNH endonuclease [Nocardioides jejuensis]
MECEVAGCERGAAKMNRWCDKHYRRWRLYGDPDAPLLKKPVAAACRYDGCGRKVIAFDLCKHHYYAERRAAERAARPVLPPPPPGMRRVPTRPNELIPVACSIEGCDQPPKVRGWCGAHYQRWRRFGDPEFFPPQVDTSCTVEGCGKPTNARGFCSSHYYRWHTYGDPLYSKNKPRVREQVVDVPPRPCATCGEQFKPANHVQRYCGRRCKPTRAHRGVNSRATVVRLGEANGWTCALCHGAVERDVYWPSPNAGSVDHVVPVVLGGTDAWPNLQLAHLRCNLAKEAVRRGRPN